MAPDETKPTGPDLSQGIPLDRLARNEGGAWHDRSTQFLTLYTCRTPKRDRADTISACAKRIGDTRMPQLKKLCSESVEEKLCPYWPPLACRSP